MSGVGIIGQIGAIGVVAVDVSRASKDYYYVGLRITIMSVGRGEGHA